MYGSYISAGAACDVRIICVLRAKCLPAHYMSIEHETSEMTHWRNYILIEIAIV